MSDYDDGWNEGFDLGARKVKELQAELKERSGLTRVHVNDILRENESLEAEVGKLQAESECGAFDHCGCKDKVAKLQAVVDAAKKVGKERGIHRYYKPMDVAIDAMLDTIKEVK